jgi:hypothetical protein
MLDQQINEHLGILQNELAKLKNVTESIENAKENSLNIIAELESVQKNFNLLHTLFTEYTEKLYSTYESNISDLKQSTEFLDKYSGIVEITNSLLKVLTEINFPERISNIEHTQSALVDIMNTQQRGLKSIKVATFVICGLILLSAVATAVFFFRNY